MICFPNAKINLGLHVVARREDGYHRIETCFYPVPLKDALEIVPADDFSFTPVGLALESASEDNLAVKALHLFKKNHHVPPLAVYLKKAIPFGAGLGGGSADAAFMLKLLNEYTSQNLSDDGLEKMAVELGADCPFFIRNRPALASEIGNIFESVDISLKGYTLCIIKPNLTVSTRQAYSLVKPATPAVSLRETLRKPIREWKHHLTNDFEMAIFPKYPVISEIKAHLYSRGAVYAAMSGSGSAVFGLFATDVDVSFQDCFIWKGKLNS